MRVLVFFFFKQKTAYEMRISDWSSDVCSSDLRIRAGDEGHAAASAPSLTTAARNASPRASKLGHWSNDAQAGDSRTTAPGTRPRCASAWTAASAVSRSPQLVFGTWPSSVSAKASAATPLRTARRTRGTHRPDRHNPPPVGPTPTTTLKIAYP